MCEGRGYRIPHICGIYCYVAYASERYQFYAFVILMTIILHILLLLCMSAFFQMNLSQLLPLVSSSFICSRT